jgi:hypothetical protein
VEHRCHFEGMEHERGGVGGPPLTRVSLAGERERRRGEGQPPHEGGLGELGEPAGEHASLGRAVGHDFSLSSQMADEPTERGLADGTLQIAR